MSIWSKLWTEIPFPTSGNKKDMLCWIINTQEQTILRLQFIMVGLVATFISVIVAGKVWLGWFI
jgi:hypothetical protein